MGKRENILAAGFKGLLTFTTPVFATANSRTVADYFQEAGEYMGKGFSQAIDEAKNQSNEKQLELFDEGTDC